MKLSNKILLFFFGFILVYMLAAFTEIRVKGQLRAQHNEHAKTEEVALPNLKYIVFDEYLDTRAYIKSSAESRIEVLSESGEILSQLEYEVKGDTLYMQRFNFGADVEHFHLNIFIPESGFIGFTSTKCNVELNDIVQDSLSINQEGGSITFQNSNEIGKLKIRETNDAQMYAYNSLFDTVSIDLNESRLSIQTRIERLEGVLSNESAVYSGDVNELQLTKDKSSSYRIIN